MPAEVAKPTRSTGLPQDVAQRSGAAGQIGRRLVTLSWAVFDWRKRGKTPAQYEPLKRRIKALLEQARQCGCKAAAR